MIRIALAGNPNSGKTTLFNALTGSTAHVGNWPGVTVDKKEGVYKKGDLKAEIVDLPGIYSLSPYTPEEVVARNYVLDEAPDCVINIVDATNLERNLYLTTQLMEVDVPIVVALNMTDLLDKKGESIDAATLEKRIGVPCVEISALRERGIEQLMKRACVAASQKRNGVSVLENSFLGKAIANAQSALKLKGVTSPLFHAVKLVEKDELEVQAHPAEAAAVEEFVKINCVGKSEFCSDTEAEIADARYKYISENFSSTIKRAKKAPGELSKSDKVDRVLTNKWAGIPIFIAILFLVFHLTFSENFLYLGSIIPSFGEWCAATAPEETTIHSVLFSGEGLNTPGTILFYLMDLITGTIGGWLEEGVAAMGLSEAVGGLICEAWGGLAAVLSFVPQIIMLLLLLSIMEDTGYMARVAFILDRIFCRFGISGRAFIPMIMGFGCSIPAMVNTRTLADERERTMTIRTIPFFSCGAKLPILVGVAGAVAHMTGLANDGSIISFAMYVLGMALAVISILLMRATTQRGEIAPFIMELPTYHAPRFKNLMIHLWDKTKHYIKKVFTIIFASAILVWFLRNFGWDWKMCDINDSILASIGQFLQPLFTPLGFGSQLNSMGWVFVVAAVTGLIAKEEVISTFALLAGVFVGLEGVALEVEGASDVMMMVLGTGITWQALIAFIVFNMTTIPCFAAVAAAKGELRKGTFKWTLLFWIVASYLSSMAVYTILTWWWTAFIWAAVAAVTIICIRLYNKKADAKAALEN